MYKQKTKLRPEPIKQKALWMPESLCTKINEIAGEQGESWSGMCRKLLKKSVKNYFRNR